MLWKSPGTSILRWFVRARPILWRALICWGLGCILLLNDEAGSLDLRFQIRGNQPVHKDIVVVKIHPDEVLANYRLRGRLSTWKDVVDLTDSFYWDPAVWKKLLGILLPQNPKAIGVTLFLSDNLNKASLSDSDLQLFRDSRVFWAAQPAHAERLTLPLFYDITGRQMGSYEVIRDEDGVIRRFGPSPAGSPHLLESMTGTRYVGENAALINYRGDKVWPEYSLTDVTSGSLPPDTFKDKYILIGGESNASSQYLTPFGPASRTDVFSNLLDNLLSDRWIQRSPYLLFTFMLFALLVVCVTILVIYPQTVAAVFLLWIATLITALSIWIFDAFNIWTPVFSAVVQMLATWVVFVGYQANRFEQKNMELKQQQKNLEELEQLKNNFVSLISHDLKTPIAKAQAVVDRLMTDDHPEELVEDLKLLRGFNEELNRYIQSILRLLRVESRNFKLTLELGDINETIEGVVRQIRPLAEQKGLAIELHLEPLFTIEGDFTLLREVILNLVENAVKYTPAGGRIEVSTRENDDEVVIEVRDTGPGIERDSIPVVWQKFARGKDQELKTTGSGLGLYLVKYFIELHGGSVHMESEVGQGTLVTVHLPLERPNKEEEWPDRGLSFAETRPGAGVMSHG